MRPEVSDRDDWPVHQPGPAYDAPIPGVHWWGGCNPDRPRVNVLTGRCEDCGERACTVCGRSNCPDHVDPIRRNRMDEALMPGSSRRRSSKPRVQMTRRQFDVATLAARGKTVQEIADELRLAHPTIKHHLDAARTKLGVENKRQLHDRLAEVHVTIKEV